MIRRFFLVIAGILTVTAMMAAQAPSRDTPYQPPAGSGTISGRVVTDELTPQPVRAAIVMLTGDGFWSGWTFVTDSDGTFAFSQLPAGRFSISVSKAGYVRTAFGALKPGRPGASLMLKEGQRTGDLTVRLPRGGVITGRVVDPSGSPVSAGLTVLRVSGRPDNRTSAFAAGVNTDDRGEYRVFGLASGDYVIGVDALQTPINVGAATRELDVAAIDQALAASTPGTPGHEVVRAAVYHPNAKTLAEATVVHVDAGQERSGIDVTASYVPAVTIEGRLVGPDGRPPASVNLNLIQPGVPRTGPSTFGRPSPVDGSFSFGGIAPGRYAIVARATPRPATAATAAAPALWARADVVVNGQPLAGVVLRLQPGVNVGGAVVFDSTTKASPPSGMRLSLQPVLAVGEVALSVADAQVVVDGAVSFAGVSPGRYRIAATLPPAAVAAGWTLASAVIDGKDVLDDGVEIGAEDVAGMAVTFSDRATEIAGVLQDATGRPAPDYYVIAFPTDPKFWFLNSRRIKTSRPGNDGKYILKDLPPGDYRIAAVTDVETNEWFEPSFLQQLVAASATLTLTDGERKIFPLKIGGG